MKKVCVFLIFFCFSLVGQEQREAPFFQDTESLLDFERQAQQSQEILIPFSFKNEPLTSVVKRLAYLKKINVIEPGDETYRKLMVTFAEDEFVTLDEAWDLLQTFLKMGGYALSLRGAGYSIVPLVDAGGRIILQKEILPLYINVEPDNLPSTDAPIRALFFLENLAIPAPAASGTDPLSMVLKDMLSVGSVPIFDPDTKSIILTDSANLIASAMKVVYALDRSGVQEMIEIVPLYNTTASVVAAFLRQGLGIVGGQAQNQPAYLVRTQRAEGHPFFSPNTSIVADDRRNALILLGREANVDRLKQFIEEYIDVPPEKGESILHTYELQYLDSVTTASVLQDLFAPIGITTADTGQAEAGALQAGPERYFQNPVVISETYTQVAEAQVIGTVPTDIAPGTILTGDIAALRPFQGGNKLIIAALRPDWEHIKEILDTIDRPMRQIIIEALIVDVEVTDEKVLRGAIRNPKAMGLEQGQSFQSQHLEGPVGDALVYNGTPENVTDDLAVDLLKKLAQDPNSTLASFVSTGSLLISFKDPTKGGIWALLQILQANTDFKILQHPSVITTNNYAATIAFQEQRRDFGTVAATSGGALTIPIVDVTAQIALTIKPRASSNDRINLDVAVEISEFPNAASNDVRGNPGQFDRRSRAIGTNLNMSNNQVVALGGLATSSTTSAETRAPVLSRIPFFGNFFRGTSQIRVKSNLLLLISARIIEPLGRSHTGPYTDEKLSRSLYHLEDEDLFSALQDPVTHFFFRKYYDEKQVLNDFLLETEGTMLDPDTYEHDWCNDEKMISKVAYTKISPQQSTNTSAITPGKQLLPMVPDTHTNDNTSNIPLATDYNGPVSTIDTPQTNINGNVINRESAQTLKDRLAHEENPLIKHH